jgi:hypothetical protein
MARNLPKTAEEVTQTAPTPPGSEEVEQEAEEIGITVPSYGVSKKRKAPEVHVQMYRVERGPLTDGGWRIVMGGGTTSLAMGKIIDARSYDIDRLKRMGVQLTKIDGV